MTLFDVVKSFAVRSYDFISLGWQSTGQFASPEAVTSDKPFRHPATTSALHAWMFKLSPLQFKRFDLFGVFANPTPIPHPNSIY
jgi:hypothetical protein